jgi:hypothetical protein
LLIAAVSDQRLAQWRGVLGVQGDPHHHIAAWRGPRAVMGLSFAESKKSP